MNLPLINDLKNPCLTKRNWEKINKYIKELNEKIEDENQKIEVIDLELNVHLKKLLDNNIHLVKEEINRISEMATKEKHFEKILNKMKSEWKNIKLEMVQFRDTDTQILKGTDVVMDKLDEDIAKTL